MSEREFRDTLQPTRKDITYQEILSTLLDKDNLDLKTQINKPKDLATLKIVAVYFDSLDLKESALLLTTYIEILNTYMVSFNRASRKEIISAISHAERVVEGIDKLTTNLK